MSAVPPSPQPAPSPRGRQPLPVEALQDILGGLLVERERMRESGDELELERNRREIVRVQREICYALIEEHVAR
jgi:hypothetical protein